MCQTRRLTRDVCSFFGDQEGDFSIEIHAIAAWKDVAENDVRREVADDDGEDEDEDEHDPKAAVAEAAASKNSQTRRRSWLRRLLCGLI
jgi:hypothetical protein